MNTKVNTAIKNIRDEIDSIDSRLLSLLKERISLAKEIGKLKDSSQKAKWDPLRERQIYDRLLTDNADTFPRHALKSIFHEIITSCRNSQQKTIISFLGPEAAFSHLAGIKYFGHSAEYRSRMSIDEIFADVKTGRSLYGIVPAENSIEGAVFSTLDCFMKYKVKICGETYIGTSYDIVCQSGNIKDIETIALYSHSLEHCQKGLHAHLPSVPLLTVSSTCAAVKMAANNPNIGAIAPSLAIKTCDLQTAVKGIENHRENSTRFLIIGKESPQRSGADKTSILLGIKDKPGALNKTLDVLSGEQINLVKIESRPIEGEQSKYLFFLDILGHMDDENIRRGCQTLKERCSCFEWFGSYPQDISTSDS